MPESNKKLTTSLSDIAGSGAQTTAKIASNIAGSGMHTTAKLAEAGMGVMHPGATKETNKRMKEFLSGRDLDAADFFSHHDAYRASLQLMQENRNWESMSWGQRKRKTIRVVLICIKNNVLKNAEFWLCNAWFVGLIFINFPSSFFNSILFLILTNFLLPSNVLSPQSFIILTKSFADPSIIGTSGPFRFTKILSIPHI